MTNDELWIQYSHLAEGGFGRVMRESDFKEFMKAQTTRPEAPRSGETPRADAVILGDWEFWPTENGKACDKTDYDALAAVARALDREATYWRKVAETIPSPLARKGESDV